MFIFLPFLFVWAVALVPDSFIEDEVKNNLQQSIVGCFFNDPWIRQRSYLCDNSNNIKGKRYISIKSETITLREPSPEIVGAIIQIEDDPFPEIPCEHIGKFRLNSRQLLYAQFTDSTFKCVEMVQTNLVGADLSGADLSGGVDLSGVNLNKSTLSGANLSGAILSGVRLSGADLSGANLSGSVLSKRAYGFYKLESVPLRVKQGGPSTLAKLNEVDWNAKLFALSNLSGAILMDADLTMADLTKINLSGADLTRANFHSADLREAELYGATLYDAQLDGTKFEGAKLYGANLSGSMLRDTSLGKADGEKPEKWSLILDEIELGLKRRGYSQDEIDERVAEIERNGDSPLGYVPPTGTDHCVLYDKEPELNLSPEWNSLPELSLPPECAEAESLK